MNVTLAQAIAEPDHAFELLKAAASGLGALIGIVGGLLISARTVRSTQTHERELSRTSHELEAARLRAAQHDEQAQLAYIDVVAAANRGATAAGHVAARLRKREPVSDEERLHFEETAADLDRAAVVARLAVSVHGAEAATRLVELFATRVRPFVYDDSADPDLWRSELVAAIRERVIGVEGSARRDQGLPILS